MKEEFPSLELLSVAASISGSGDPSISSKTKKYLLLFCFFTLPVAIDAMFDLVSRCQGLKGPLIFLNLTILESLDI